MDTRWNCSRESTTPSKRNARIAENESFAVCLEQVPPSCSKVRAFTKPITAASLTKKAKDYIADKGFDKQYGARPLKRAIQKYIEDALAEEIVNSKLEEGDSISMDYQEKGDKLTIKIKKAKKSSEA